MLALMFALFAIMIPTLLEMNLYDQMRLHLRACSSLSTWDVHIRTLRMCLSDGSSARLPWTFVMLQLNTSKRN